jgi:lysophospholipase
MMVLANRTLPNIDRTVLWLWKIWMIKELAMTVNRQITIDYLKTLDSLPIRFGFWPCAEEEGQVAGSIVLLNGRGEFMEKYAEPTQELHQRRFDVFSMDWRGQGLSGRLLPDRLKGHVHHFDDYVGDLVCFFESIVFPRAIGPIIIMAHSMGAHLALRHLKEERHDINRAVLLSPMVDIHAPWPGRLVRKLLRLPAMAGLGEAYVPGTARYHPGQTPFKGNRLSSDPVRFADHGQAVTNNPDLTTGGPTWGWLGAAVTSIEKLQKKGYLESIDTQTLIVSAGNDRIVSNPAQHVAAARLPRAQLITVAGARHEILKERNCFRNQFWKAFDAFVSAGNE